MRDLVRARKFLSTVDRCSCGMGRADHVIITTLLCALLVVSTFTQQHGKPKFEAIDANSVYSLEVPTALTIKNVLIFDGRSISKTTAIGIR